MASLLTYIIYIVFGLYGEQTVPGGIYLTLEIISFVVVSLGVGITLGKIYERMKTKDQKIFARFKGGLYGYLIGWVCIIALLSIMVMFIENCSSSDNPMCGFGSALFVGYGSLPLLIASVLIGIWWENKKAKGNKPIT